MKEVKEIKEAKLLNAEKDWKATEKGSSMEQSPKKEPLSPEKTKALDLAMKQIKKDFGDGSIMKLGESQNMAVETISTGSINLNMALGVGGVPRGRIIEVYGAESSGKTTLALHILAEAQRTGGIGAFIDAEHALDPEYAKALGVDIDELLISQPDYGEQALEIADMLIRSGAVDVIVVDSVAALVPKVEIDGEMSDQQMGLQARLMSKALRKLTGTLNKSKTTMIFINQIREKIGGGGFGPQTTTTGGKALKFYASVRMEVRRIGSVKQGDEMIGNETLVKVTKNKVAPPFKDASFQIVYGKGISRIGEIFELALDNNIISKAGAWFSFGDQRLGQGKENVKAKLEENKELFQEIETQVLAVMIENRLKSTKKPLNPLIAEDSEDTLKEEIA
jgi:recombination protein RecA